MKVIKSILVKDPTGTTNSFTTGYPIATDANLVSMPVGLLNTTNVEDSFRKVNDHIVDVKDRLSALESKDDVVDSEEFQNLSNTVDTQGRTIQTLNNKIGTLPDEANSVMEVINDINKELSKLNGADLTLSSLGGRMEEVEGSVWGLEVWKSNNTELLNGLPEWQRLTDLAQLDHEQRIKDLEDAVAGGNAGSGESGGSGSSNDDLIMLEQQVMSNYNTIREVEAKTTNLWDWKAETVEQLSTMETNLGNVSRTLTTVNNKIGALPDEANNLMEVINDLIKRIEALEG